MSNDTCPRCGARNAEDAATRCRPSSDETGEYSCPGVEWPLEDIWAGELTAEAAEQQIADEDAALEKHHAAYLAAREAP